MLSACGSDRRERAVVVAVAVVRMVEMPVHQVVGVIAVGHGLVTAARAVLVTGLVRAAVVIGRTALGIRFVDRDRVLVHVVSMGMMQVAVVQVVHVVGMAYSCVSTIGAVLVVVALVYSVTIAHLRFSLVRLQPA